MTAGSRVLADTCIWVEYFRTRSPLSEELKKLITEERIVTTGVVILELLQGAKTPKAKELIKETLLALPVLETTVDDWVLAGEMGQVLRVRGLTIPATDLLLAAVAKRSDCDIFTVDSHFNSIPELHAYPFPQ
jgi:predicted nucleic acid-binding protein